MRSLLALGVLASAFVAACGAGSPTNTPDPSAPDGAPAGSSASSSGSSTATCANRGGACECTCGTGKRPLAKTEGACPPPVGDGCEQVCCVPGAADGGALGCASGSVTCGAGMQCCSGVPYPTEGICQGVCDSKSDRAAKRDFSPVDGDAVLERLARLPITEWTYREEPGVRHLGPMAQDFKATFGLGNDDRRIHGVDADGVAFAAIQALERRVSGLEREARELREENARLRHRVGERGGKR